MPGWLKRRKSRERTAEQVLKAFRRRHWLLYLRVRLFPPKPRGLEHWLEGDFLAPTAELAEAWGLSGDELEVAFSAGPLFRVQVNGVWYVPTCWITLGMGDVVAVCEALSGGDVVSKMLFWRRRHGGIGAQTAAAALEAGKLERVVELATAEALEEGWRSQA